MFRRTGKRVVGTWSGPGIAATFALAMGLFAIAGMSSARAQESATTGVASEVTATPEAAAPETTASETPVTESAAAAEPAAPPAADAATNSWMLVCSALVLFMTAPGLALFYGGLVRRKNVLSVMMQCIFLMGLMTVVWALYG